MCTHAGSNFFDFSRLKLALAAYLVWYGAGVPDLAAFRPILAEFWLKIGIAAWQPGEVQPKQLCYLCTL